MAAQVMTRLPEKDVIDRKTIDMVVDQLVENRLDLAMALFDAAGIAPPAARWQPAPADLDHAALRFLLAHWQGLAEPGALPLYSRIDAIALKPALGYIMLLDVLDDGWDYRYRVYGSEIARLARRDYTGLRTSELNVGAVVPMFYIAGYRAVSRRRIPLYTRNQTPPEVSTHSWSRLILPLVDAEDRIVRFLVGNVPGPWRAAS